jgi:basic amino acid/polyamine antiporter, APA family
LIDDWLVGWLIDWLVDCQSLVNRLDDGSIGWNLTLEYAISASAVARSWGGYVVNIFENFGVTVPLWIYNYEVSSLIVLSPLSLVIIVLCTLVLLLGVKSGAIFNNIITVLNIAIILFIIGCGAYYWESDNLVPFFPFGFHGVLKGGGTVFFSYIGFDSITTLAGEVRNPGRDLPIGIMYAEHHAARHHM